MDDEFELSRKLQEHDKAWSLLYHRIGLWLTVYQGLEDRLDDLFVLFSRDVESAARGVFSQIHRLDGKLEAITSVSLNHDQDIQRLWTELRGEILYCAENRNQIAHSSGFAHGGTITVYSSGTITHTQTEPIAQARKRTKSGEVRWDAEKLLVEFRHLEALLNKLGVLRHYLSNGSIPEHFKGRWNDPVVQSWPTK